MFLNKSTFGNLSYMPLICIDYIFWSNSRSCFDIMSVSMWALFCCYILPILCFLTMRSYQIHTTNFNLSKHWEIFFPVHSEDCKWIRIINLIKFDKTISKELSRGICRHWFSIGWQSWYSCLDLEPVEEMMLGSNCKFRIIESRWYLK